MGIGGAVRRGVSRVVAWRRQLLAYCQLVSSPVRSRPRLRLTRRGRLVRTLLVLLLAIALVLALVSLVRALAAPGADVADAAESTSSAGSASDEGGSPPADGASTPDAETPDAEAPDSADEIVATGTVGDGTWTVAVPVDADAAPSADAEDDGAGADGAEVRTYAVRVEGGIGVDADEAAEEIAAILADPRGWQELEGVRFVQVADPADAAMTLSIGSPPTVDEMCLPARTGGRWSCRIGAQVALNSDRWLHATPTYDDLALYRAYMINHEVGHFLGHGHRSCPGAGEPAPVMLQQSIDLQGCVPNTWPSAAA